jgi:hypothetical protein
VHLLLMLNGALESCNVGLRPYMCMWSCVSRESCAGQRHPARASVCDHQVMELGPGIPKYTSRFQPKSPRAGPRLRYFFFFFFLFFLLFCCYLAASTKCMGCFSSVIIFVDLMCTTSPVRRKGHRLDGAKLIFSVLFFVLTGS